METEAKIAKAAKQHTVYKTSSGKRVPSVTTIIGVIAKPALIPWANRLGLEGTVYEDYLKESGKVGTLAHEMIQEDMGGPAFAWDRNAYTQDQIDQAEISRKNFELWCKSKPSFNPEAIEVPLVSDSCGFGGRIDLLARIDGDLWLIDFKTGKGIFPEMEVQVAAYNYLLDESGYKIKGSRILRFGRAEEGGFEDCVLSEGKIRAAWNVFECALSLYRAKQIHEKTK